MEVIKEMVSLAVLEVSKAQSLCGLYSLALCCLSSYMEIGDGGNVLFQSSKFMKVCCKEAKTSNVFANKSKEMEQNISQ